MGSHGMPSPAASSTAHIKHCPAKTWLIFLKCADVVVPAEPHSATPSGPKQCPHAKKAAFAVLQLQGQALLSSGAGWLLKLYKRPRVGWEGRECTPIECFNARKGAVSFKWSWFSELFTLTFSTATIFAGQKGHFCNYEQVYQKHYFNSSAENTAALWLIKQGNSTKVFSKASVRGRKQGEPLSEKAAKQNTYCTESTGLQSPYFKTFFSMSSMFLKQSAVCKERWRVP